MPIQQITPPEAKAALDANPDAVYLDVRTEMEFAMGHPDGAINIPVVFPDPSTGGMRLNPDFVKVVEKVILRDRTILCGCQMGGRSQKAAEILTQAGYADVANVQGGFGGMRDMAGRVVVPGWQASGLPVSTGAGDDDSYAGLRKKAGL
jgi:rhodanese-related sulfurtransferase